MSIAHQSGFGELRLLVICAENLKHPGGFRLLLTTHVSVSTSEHVRLANESASSLLGPSGKPRSAAVSGASNPRWEHAFELSVLDPLAAVFVGVCDDDGVLVGQVEIKLFEYRDHASHLNWFPLASKATGQPNGNGEIQIEVTYHFPPAWQDVYAAVSHCERKDFGTALPLLERLVSVQPTSTPAYATLLGMRSNAFLQLGKFDEALRDAEQLIELNPNAADGYYRKAMIFYAIVDFERATAIINAGLDIDPSSRQLLSLADDITKNAFRQRLKTLLDAARRAVAEQRYTAAVDCFSAAIEQNPANHIYLVYRSLCFLAMGDMRAAHADIWRAVEMEPSWAREPPVVKKGVLRKVGRVNPMKKSRWFVLKYNYLFYFQVSTIREPPPSGVIIVRDYVPKYTRDDKAIELQDFRGRVFKLEADTAADSQSWKDALTGVPRMSPLPEDPNETRIQWQPKAAHVTGIVGIVKNRLTGRLRPAPILLQRVRKSGDLFKKGVLNAAWKRRWFVVIDGDPHLYWFDSKPARLDGPAQPHKRVDLTNATGRHVDAVEFKEADAYEQPPGPVFQIEAEGELFILSHDARQAGEADAWLSIVRSVSHQYRGGESSSVAVPHALLQPPVEPAPQPPPPPSSTEHAAAASSTANEDTAVDERSDDEQVASPRQHVRKITRNEMSTSEARYFAKFGIDSSLASPPPPLSDDDNDNDNDNDNDGNTIVIPHAPRPLFNGQQRPVRDTCVACSIA